VAVTGSVGTTEIADGAITNAKLATDAVQGSDIEALAVSEAKLAADAVTLEKLADASVTSDNLLVDKNADSTIKNIIDGLNPLEGDVAVDDYLIVHDTSIDTEGEEQLFKAKVSAVQKVGTTEYVVSSESDANGPTVAGTATAKTVEIDMDGSPFQTLGTDPPDGATTREYTFSLSNQSANSVKLVTIKIDGPSSDSADLAFPGWHWPERETGAPSSIATGKVAILSITSFGGSASTVIAAYAVT
jgi:hypothetical protein